MRLTDGFSTIISFAANPVVKFYEKTVTPPGFAGGGPNDTTGMRNVALRTRHPKKLKTMTAASAVVAYDSAVFGLAEVWAMINVNQLITVTFPDGSDLSFYGWLDSFVPNEHREGEEPTANIVVETSNMNASLVETNPSFVP